MSEQKMRYQDEAEYQNHVTNFLNECNTPGSKGCRWIVRVQEKTSNGPPRVTARIAFTSHAKYVLVVNNFLDWYYNTYLKNNSSSNETWVEICTNYTPTEICVPKLRAWILKNPNVRRLTINFGFIYTWKRKLRKVSQFVYVRCLQRLANIVGVSVRVQKIRTKVLASVARQARVPFTGYRNPPDWNKHLQRYVVTHSYRDI